MPDIPTKPDDITKEWLQNILGIPDVSIQEIRMEPAASKGDNFASNVQRVHLTGLKGNESFEKGVVVKFLSLVPWQRQMAIKGRLFYTEAEFYNSILPDMIHSQTQTTTLEVPVPRNIYCAAENEAGVVVTEDLAPEEYKMVKKKIDLDEDHCLLVLEELAKFHATGLNLKFSKGPQFWTDYKELFVNYWSIMAETAKPLFLTGLKRADQILSFEEDPQSILTDKADELIEKALKSVDPQEPLATICHGDFWANNFLFKYCEKTGKPTSVKFLDCQMIKYSLPLADLAFFLCVCISPKARKNKVRDFFAFYRDCLVKYLNILGVTQIPQKELEFEKLWDDYYKKYIYLGYLMAYWLLCELVEKTKERIKEDGSKNKEEDVESGLTAAFGGGSIEMLVKTSDIKERFRELLNETIE